MIDFTVDDFALRCPSPALRVTETKSNRMLVMQVGGHIRSFASSVNTSTAVCGIPSLTGFQACLSPVTSNDSAFCSPDFLSPHS